MSRRLTTAIATVLAGAVLSACSESTYIRTNPPGAQLYINDRYVGVTPVMFTVKRSEWPVAKPEFRYRVEHASYPPVEGIVPVGVNWRRMMTAGLTSGINLIFKRPVAFKHDTTDISLEPAPVVPAARTVEARLHELDDLRDRGLVSKEEYERARAEILNAL